MSNHFHLVVRYDPNTASHWSDEEVARRWCALFNGLPLDQRSQGPTVVDEFNLQQSLRYHELLTAPEAIARCRAALGSLSRFMQHLKQPFAVWANHEDECTGHFFESRFYSGVLLTESDLLSCMAYVDLNPVEAGMARSLRACHNTSVHERLYAERFDPERLEAYLSPVWQEASELQDVDADAHAPRPRYTLKAYVEQLNLAIIYKQNPDPRVLDRVESWMARLLNRDRDKARTVPAFFDYV